MGGILKYVARSSSCGQTGGASEFCSSTKLVAGSAFRAGFFFSLNASCERSSTIDQKGVKQAFRRYHACLGRKVSNAVGRLSKPLPRMCLDKHVGSIFGKIFLLLRLFRKNEEELIAIKCPGYPLAKHENSRTIRLRLDTFPK